MLSRSQWLKREAVSKITQHHHLLAATIARLAVRQQLEAEEEANKLQAPQPYEDEYGRLYVQACDAATMA